MCDFGTVDVCLQQRGKLMLTKRPPPVASPLSPPLPPLAPLPLPLAPLPLLLLLCSRQRVEDTVSLLFRFQHHCPSTKCIEKVFFPKKERGIFVVNGGFLITLFIFAYLYHVIFFLIAFVAGWSFWNNDICTILFQTTHVLLFGNS